MLCVWGGAPGGSLGVGGAVCGLPDIQVGSDTAMGLGHCHLTIPGPGRLHWACRRHGLKSRVINLSLSLPFCHSSLSVLPPALGPFLSASLLGKRRGWSAEWERARRVLGAWQAHCPSLLLAVETHLFLGISPFMKDKGGEVPTGTHMGEGGREAVGLSCACWGPCLFFAAAVAPLCLFSTAFGLSAPSAKGTLMSRCRSPSGPG